MSFRAVNQKYLGPLSQVVMVFGIVCLCQPWLFDVHRYGLTITLAGLILFNVTSKIGPEPQGADAEPRPGQGSDH